MTRNAMARRIAEPYLMSQQRGEAPAPPQPEGLARILAGCFAARQSKTTAGILSSRIDFLGARYHLLNLGFEKRFIFRSQRCCKRFFELPLFRYPRSARQIWRKQA